MHNLNCRFYRQDCIEYKIKKIILHSWCLFQSCLLDAIAFGYRCITQQRLFEKVLFHAELHRSSVGEYGLFDNFNFKYIVKNMENTLFNFTARGANGKNFDFAALKGKVVLVVNTASKCGFTPQYAGLETLYKDYKDRGLVVVGFPCDQFAHQEPLSDAEITEFCSINFGVTFPLMSKIDVNGKNTDPVFTFLKERAPGLIGKSIKWNFTKFLVERDGITVTRYDSRTEPESIRSDIETALAEANT